MANLGDMPRVTLYSACLSGWLNIRVTSEQHVPQVPETRNVSIVSQNVCVSRSNFVARYKVSEVAKLGDIEGTCHVALEMSPSLASLKITEKDNLLDSC